MEISMIYMTHSLCHINHGDFHGNVQRERKDEVLELLTCLSMINS